MAASRLSKSLDKLRSQVNTLAPKRSKASDGWIGDAKHSMRRSDHNPEPDGTVDALDITHDPKSGVDIQKLCDALVASRDPRISYLICNGKIIAGKEGPKPWQVRTYTGSNKHTKHLHVSILDAKQDDTTPWKIEAAFDRPAAAKIPTALDLAVDDEERAVQVLPVEDVEHGRRVYIDADTIARVQTALKALGYTEVGAVDGKIGKFTKTAILAFRNENDLPTTADIDDELLLALGKAPPRGLAAERTEATRAEVGAKAPETQANGLNKVLAGVAAAPAGIGLAVTGVLESVPQAKGLLESVKDMLGSVPTWLWFLIVLAVAGAIFQLARKGENAGVEAYRAGERR